MLIARLNNIGRRQVAGYSLLKKVYHHFSDKVKNLDIHTFTIQNNKYDFYLSNAVKKLLTFNHY